MTRLSVHEVREGSIELRQCYHSSHCHERGSEIGTHRDVCPSARPRGSGRLSEPVYSRRVAGLISGRRVTGQSCAPKIIAEIYASGAPRNGVRSTCTANLVIAVEASGDRASVVSDVVAYEFVAGWAWTINMIGQCHRSSCADRRPMAISERRVIDAHASQATWSYRSKMSPPPW